MTNRAMTKQDFSKWLRTAIADLDHPDPDVTIAESAAMTVREARRIAETLSYPDLLPPCKTPALALPVARRFLSKALAVVDPPATGPLTVKQAAERLGVSIKTVYGQIEKGKLRCVRIGRAIRIQPGDLDTTEGPKYKHLRL